MPGNEELPSELLPFASAIEATRKPILGVAVEGKAPSGPLASRVGGMPWWPAERPYPVDRRGKPLLLLTQINFAEVPRLEGFPVRACFSCGTDDLMGMNLDALLQPTGFHCVYHTDFS